jgi:U4/U6.U5 tri-snRNP component SNU23
MSAYNNAARGGDTDFRKKWDRATYAELGREREEREREEAKARYEAKLGIKPKLKKAPTDEETRPISARKKQDWSAVTGKSYLVPLGASVGRKGKGAGFYCDACDETFKDNNSWVDHINSKQHLQKTGQSFYQEKATLEECLAHLEMLKQRKAESANKQAYNIDAELKKRRLEEQEAKDAARQAKKAKQQAVKEEQPTEDTEMSRMMGFGGFATTKT